MFQKAKENWRQFKESQPGHRFQDRYHCRQQETGGRFDLSKIFNIFGGIAIVLAGLFFIPAPGPGSAIIVVGLGLIGSEFQPVARFLDGAEVKLRKLAQEAKGIWNRSSVLVKVLISLIILGCTTALGYGAYELFFDDSKQ
jgi:Putative transmembrane protein (PGPGW)